MLCIITYGNGVFDNFFEHDEGHVRQGEFSSKASKNTPMVILSKTGGEKVNTYGKTIHYGQMLKFPKIYCPYILILGLCNIQVFVIIKKGEIVGPKVS